MYQDYTKPHWRTSVGWYKTQMHNHSAEKTVLQKANIYETNGLDETRYFHIISASTSFMNCVSELARTTCPRELACRLASRVVWYRDKICLHVIFIWWSDICGRDFTVYLKNVVRVVVLSKQLCYCSVEALRWWSTIRYPSLQKSWIINI